MRYFLYMVLVVFLLGCAEGNGTQDIDTVSALGDKSEFVEECIPNTIVGSYNSRYTTTDVSLDGTNLVLAHANGIDILDITNKSEPTLQGSMTIQDSITKAKIRGKLVFAYLANEKLNDLSIKVINISNVANPTEVSTIPVRVVYEDIHVDGDYIHFGGEINATTGRYYIYDVSDQFNPVEAASLDLSVLGDPNTFYLALRSFVQQGNLLYAQNYNALSINNIYVIDITDRQNPVELSDIASGQYYLCMNGEHIFAGGDGQLKSYYLAQPDYIYSAGETNATEDYHHITSIDDTVYSFGKLSGEISMTDFSDLNASVSLEEKIYVHDNGNMVNDGRYLYVADGAGLKIIDTCQ